MTRHHDIDPRDTDAKLDLQRREQLSALVDGELAHDQRQFLLRRLSHDADLAGRLERWQLAGDVLRGALQGAMPAGAGFPARVAQAVAAAPAAAPHASTARRRWSRVTGFAAAASIAAVALLVVRPQVQDTTAPTAPVATATLPVEVSLEPGRVAGVPQFAAAADPRPAPAPTGDVRPAPRPDAPSRALASLDVPATPAPGSPIEPAPPVEPAAILAAGDLRPFTPAATIEPQARPWPRAVLPRSADGGLVVGYDDAPAPSFHPFEPRLPEDSER